MRERCLSARSLLLRRAGVTPTSLTPKNRTLDFHHLFNLQIDKKPFKSAWGWVPFNIFCLTSSREHEESEEEDQWLNDLSANSLASRARCFLDWDAVSFLTTAPCSSVLDTSSSCVFPSPVTVWSNWNEFNPEKRQTQSVKSTPVDQQVWKDFYSCSLVVIDG